MKNIAVQLRTELEGSESWELLCAGLFCGLSYEVWANKKRGHRCGYVGIPKGHPWFDLDSRRIGKNDPCPKCAREAPAEWRGNVSVHGGLSYASKNGHGPDAVYVVGFSCDTCSDLADPTLNKQFGEDDAAEYKAIGSPWEKSVKSTEYCVEQCKNLCAAIANKWEAVAA